MSSKWKSRSLVKPGVVSGGPSQKIKQLELLLSKKDETIAALERKLAEQAEASKKLRRERNELREKNASLVMKLAEVSRKSVANNTPPNLSRLPSLPSTPGSPTIIPNGNSTPGSAKGTEEHTKNGTETTNPVMNEYSDTDYSDLDEDESTDITEIKSNGVTELDKKISAVIGAVKSSTTPVLIGYTQKRDDVNSLENTGWKHQSNAPPFASVRHHNSNSSSSSDSREGSHSLENTSLLEHMTQSKPHVKKIGSSETLASAIRQILPHRQNSSDLEEKKTFEPNTQHIPGKDSDMKNLDNNKTTLVPVKNVNSTVVATGNVSSSLSSQNQSSSKGEVAKRRAMFENHPSTAINQKTSRSDSTSSEGISSDCAFTDVESSVDTISPPETKPEAPPQRGIVKSLPDLISSNSQNLANGRKKLTLERLGAMDDSNILHEEEEDEVNELVNFQKKVRSRTQTLSGLTGGKRRMEIGRKKIREHKSDMKRATSVTSQNIAQAKEQTFQSRSEMKMELELLSPLLAAKIKNMTLNRIYNQYGGKDVVMRAIIIIEGAYQAYRLRKRFLERLKEKREHRSMQRKRAQTMKRPLRTPSIMDKHGSRYKGRKGVAIDPMMKSKETAERLAKERLPHAHSGSRLELVEKRRSEVCLNIKSEIKEGKDEEVDDNKEEQTSDTCLSIEMEYKSETEHHLMTSFSSDSASETTSLKDKPDGIAASDSTISFVSLQPTNRPPSIFSTTSTESSLSRYSLDVTKSLTLPPPNRMVYHDPKEEMSMELRTGIHYFNRKPTKGIQYLIKKSLLEDDPKKVANFLVYQKGLSKEKIGEFLGEINREFNMAVLESMVEHSHMGDKPIDEALREFQQLFRMPGEAQKIDKIMEVFALEYYKHNKSSGIFKSEDGAYILSFSIMMLHTSLHNPSVKARTSRKQWLSMNRGTNDGENFLESYLNEIFDRIQTTEFATGKDHTHTVAEIERAMIGSPIQKLSTSQRCLVHKLNVTEVQELSVRPGFRNRHRRTLFFFNDIAVVCKRKHNEFLFRENFSLLNIIPVKFETPYYKCGIQLHAADRDTPYQFNCDSNAEREDFLNRLDVVINHLKVLENERIAELGTTLSTNPVPEMATHSSVKHTLSSGAGDLISSINLALPNSSLPTKHRGDYVVGVGDLAMTSSLPSMFNSENRISRDSGFSSHQLTPTPPPSPDSCISNEMDTTACPPSSITPQNFLVPGPANLQSKSSETLNTKVNTLSPHRSPSMGLLGRRKSSPVSNSPSVDRKIKSKKERASSEKKKLFSFSKAKGDGGKNKSKDSSNTASPLAHMKLEREDLTTTYDSTIDTKSKHGVIVTLNT